MKQSPIQVWGQLLEEANGSWIAKFSILADDSQKSSIVSDHCFNTFSHTEPSNFKDSAQLDFVCAKGLNNFVELNKFVGRL